MSRVYVALSVLAWLCVATEPAAAGGKDSECKPNGPPTALGDAGTVAVAQPIDYWGEAWLLVADKLVKADKLRLVSASGQSMELGKPPVTVEPQFWLARGRAVYALAKGRSQTPGKTDVLLMRWGTDPRPRMTVLHTADASVGQFSAAFVNEFLAMTWAEKQADGSLHRLVSFVDSEDLRVSQPQDLGPDAGVASRTLPVTKGFVVVWNSPSGVMHAQFDQRGGPKGPAASADLPSTAPVRALARCGDQLWVVQDTAKELVVATGALTGKLAEVARLPQSPAADGLPLHCTDGGVAIVHRSLSTKPENITLWVSNVSNAGKVRERRIRDMKGNADTIRAPQLTAAGAKLYAWWAEGPDPAAKLWARELSCE